MQNSLSEPAAPAAVRTKTASPSLRLAGGLLAIGSAGCLIWTVSPGGALLAGMAIALAWGNPFENATRQASNFLLKASVVLLGAGMNLGVIWRVGAHDFGYTVISIAATLALGLWLGRRARLSGDVSLLVATGTAICGGSAIAAIAGVIKPKHHDITVAMTTVFLLNAVALLIFPAIGRTLGFSQHQFGLWAALAIHDTSSVVGAALEYGRVAVDVATTVKLTRALWIVPVALAVGLWWPREKTEKSAPRRPLWRRLPVPGFILGFIALAAAFTWFGALAPLAPPVTAASHRLFGLTLFLIGAGFSRSAFRVVGVKPLVVGVALWVVVATATATALHLGWMT